MIAKHSHDETARGEGVEVVYNEQRRHPVYGLGQYTEKKIHLSRFHFTGSYSQAIYSASVCFEMLSANCRAGCVLLFPKSSTLRRKRGISTL